MQTDAHTLQYNSEKNTEFLQSKLFIDCHEINALQSIRFIVVVKCKLHNFCNTQLKCNAIFLRCQKSTVFSSIFNCFYFLLIFALALANTHTDAFGEYSLTDMINAQSQGIEYEEADDGFPSYKFLPTSDVKTSYRVLLPERLYEFAILVKFLPNSPKGGYLFSVINSFESVVQLGLHLSTVSKNFWNVSLLYTQSDQSSVSRKLVSYQLPYRGKEWTTLSFQVLREKVLFYYDCELNTTTTVVREPQELVFDSASTLYLAQAGPKLTGHFEVSDFGYDLLLYFFVFIRKYAFLGKYAWRTSFLRIYIFTFKLFH